MELLNKKAPNYTEAEIDILRKIPEPEYDQELLEFLEAVKLWVENNKKPEFEYFYTTINREELSYERLSAEFYTEEARTFFKYIEI